MQATNLKRKAGRFALIGFIALFLIVVPGKSRSLELGLTPSHVYSLWSNINRALLIYAKLVNIDQARLARIESMQPRNFEAKRPADVFAMAEKFRNELKGYVPWTKETPGWLIEYEKVGKSRNPQSDKITPSAVFLISMQLLNGIVAVVVDNTGWEVSVSELYDSSVPSGMTPSDVFGQVDLALRRIDLILPDPSGGS
ncbi:MAG: hypothetical protein ISR45_05175 [Rhodospirillales bacterium]|nr:hypothetical protein [Rhodospirillales bacterium]